jgi:hypothetical protein
LEWRRRFEGHHAGFLAMFHFLVLAVAVVPLRNVWTRAGAGARIREAVVSVKTVRTCRGEVLYIRPDSAPERVQNLSWRIPGNDVAADDIAGHLPASAKIDTVDVSADIIILDQVVLAYTQEPQAEIVAIGGGGG